MGKDAVEAAEDASKVLHTRRLQAQTTREVLSTRKHRRRLIKCMSAIVDSAAALGRLMNSTQVLPFTRTHLRTARRRAIVIEQSYDEHIEVARETSRQLVAP